MFSLARRSLTSRSKRLKYVGCDGLLLTAAGNLNGSLVPDAIHPSPAGFDKLFSECWQPGLGKILADQACRGVSDATLCATFDGRTGQCSGGECQVGQLCTGKASSDCFKRLIVSLWYQQRPLLLPGKILKRSLGMLHGAHMQVSCNPATNCPGPCKACNLASDTCETVAFNGTCKTTDQKTGRCVSGACKVRSCQEDADGTLGASPSCCFSSFAFPYG